MLSKKWLFFLALFFFFFFSRTLMHFNLFTNYYDEYCFDHSLWQAIKHPSMPATGHFSPILLVFALPFLIYPSPLWIFAIQSLFVAGIGTLILHFASEQLEEKEIKLVLILLLTNVIFRYMGFNDFHQDILIAFIISVSLYLLLSWNQVFLSSFLMLCGFLAKEVAGLAIASFGLFILCFKKEKLWGIFLFLAGLIGTAVLAKEVIPRIFSTEGYQFSNYYSQFGDNIYQQIINMLIHPLRTLKFICTPENLVYVILLFGPLGFLPFFFPKILMIGILPLFEHLLSNYSFQKDVTTQYSYVLLPVLFYSLILAIRSLKEKGNWERVYRQVRPIIAFFVALSLIAFIFLNLRIFIPTPRILSAHKLLRLIPGQAPVSASKPLIVHLQYRDNILLFPNVKKADYVIFEDINWQLFQLKGDDLSKLKALLQTKQYETLLSFVFLGQTFPDPVNAARILSFKNNSRFKLIKEENGFCLYQRKGLQ